MEAAPTGLDAAGPHTLTVKTIDAAGKSSDNATLTFTATADGPSGIWHLDGDGADSSGVTDLTGSAAPPYV
ncbi:hypothetical protein, partial [Knoellia sinensis]|uniref:hypothetical protein n=1 Tax=Knoellia sinensis TaxID=136100 RepID=UPI0012EB286F